MLYDRIRASSNIYFYLLNIVRSVVEKLGHGRISKIKIVGNEEVEQSIYGQVVLRMPSDTDEQLATEARKAGSVNFNMVAMYLLYIQHAFHCRRLGTNGSSSCFLGQFLLRNKR